MLKRRLLLLILLPTLASAQELTEQLTATPIPWDAKSAPFITSIARDPATARLWVGAEDAGAWSSDGKTWTRHTTKTGLIEDTVHALAVDRQGRVWAGHGRHGVSVYDGQSWKNYDALSGGPLGSRVFSIKICPGGPRAGEVWIATDLGITRYSPKDDAWSHVTRADGLPSDQIQALAFDLDGRAYAGTQCDGLAIADPAGDYAAWTHVDGPTRATTAPAGDGLPSCMVNDVLVTREGVVYVATPWGLAKSADAGKTFTYRRGEDWFAKARQRTGGPPAGVVNVKDAWLLAEDFVTCLAEDQMGLIWLGYRTAGYEVIDEVAQLTRYAAAFGPAKGKPGEFATCILPLPESGPLIGTYGAGLLQSEKYFTGDARVRPAPVAAPANVKHPTPAAAPAPRAVDKMQARLAAIAAKPQPLTAAFLGDDWTTQGDWMGRYGRQVHAFPFYGTAGWASETFDIKVQIGPHQNKNKGGPYTYFHGLKATNDRVLYIPNSASRYPGEWNDGSFDRDAYHDEWEGPDLWVEVKVPTGTHRLSAYFMNVDAHTGGPTTRRRDYLLELKAHAPTIAQADFAPALARARVTQWYGGVYKQFVVAGPAQYYLKVGRNYSMATKVNAVFLDRLEGPTKPNEPQGVPLMGEAHQIKPPDVQAVAGPTTTVAARAAFDVTAALDKAWNDAAAAPLQRPFRLHAIRLAADQSVASALLDKWKFALPFMTDVDHRDVARTIDAWQQQQWASNPHMVDTAFRTKFRDSWKRIDPLVKSGKAPDPATIARKPAEFATPQDVQAALAPYLLLRAQQPVEARDLSNGADAPDRYFDELKASAKDPKAAYRLAGQFLLYAEAMAQLKANHPKRQSLAAALGTVRAATEVLDDSWLAARAAEAVLLPKLKFATREPGPLSRQAVLTAFITAHADDPKSLTASFQRLTDAATGPAAASLHLELAKAFQSTARPREALEHLDQIPAKLRTNEVDALRKELAAPR